MTESDIATIGKWSYGFAMAAYVAFSVRLALSFRPTTRAALLLAATVASALWTGAGVLVAVWPGQLSWLAAMVLDALRYAAWLLFLAALLREDGGLRLSGFTPAARWLVLIGACGLALTVVFSDGQPFARLADAAERTLAYGVHLGLAILGLILVEQVVRRTDKQGRWAIRPLCIGLAGLFALDLLYYSNAMLFGRLDVDIWIARGVASALVIPFIAVATARNPGWAIDLHVSRTAVFHSTAILVSAVFLLLVAGAGYLVRFFGGEWGAALQIEVLFAALLIGALIVSSGSFRSKLRVFVSKHFFSYRYDYREEWLRFTRTLSAETSLRGVQEHSIKALADLVESPGGALWLSGDKGQFRLAARFNLAVPADLQVADKALPAFLQRTGWIVDLVEYAADPTAYRELQAAQWPIAIPQSWLVVPLNSGPDLIGFVVLARSRADVEVNWEVRDLLKTASRQAASYLGQILASDALLEARKFDAFNRMSAFVVHDLKNLVAQLSLMLRNAERHRDNLEFQRDMLSTVENVVGRMNHLMLQLRAGATPPGKPRLTNLESVVRRVCSAQQRPAEPIELDLAGGLHALGHEDRLDHIVGHLVRNALDATVDGGSVRVRLYGDHDFAVVEVNDSGIGMSEDFVRDRLFKPFETSKATGTGIGVYESAQYVSGLGGELVVDSALGVGTTVRLRLPTGDRPQSSEATQAVA